MKKKVRMKIYIWRDPYDVRWGMSCLIVAAETEEDARCLAPECAVAPYGDPWPDKKGIAAPERAPDHVIDAPGICYEWAE